MVLRKDHRMLENVHFQTHRYKRRRKNRRAVVAVAVAAVVMAVVAAMTVVTAAVKGKVEVGVAITKGSCTETPEDAIPAKSKASAWGFGRDPGLLAKEALPPRPGLRLTPKLPPLNPEL